MSFDNPLTYRKTNAGAGADVVLAMQSLKGQKDGFSILLLKTDSIVLDQNSMKDVVFTFLSGDSFYAMCFCGGETQNVKFPTANPPIEVPCSPASGISASLQQACRESSTHEDFPSVLDSLANPAANYGENGHRPEGVGLQAERGE